MKSLFGIYTVDRDCTVDGDCTVDLDCTVDGECTVDLDCTVDRDCMVDRDCTVVGDAGTDDFSLLLGILHVCGHPHVRSHVSPSMDWVCLDKKPYFRVHSVRKNQKQLCF